MSSQKPDYPIFLIIAGPNGSGKSSVYQDADFETHGRSIWIINPDLLSARIAAVEGLSLMAANLAAVQRIEVWLEASIQAHQTIGVETVLSTAKYREFVRRAKALGFQFWLIYVLLDNPLRNVERVRLRVMKGGHDVPEDKIIARHARSLEQMPWYLDQADRAWIFDNSGEKPQLLGEKQQGTITFDSEAPASIIEAVRNLQTGE